MRLSISLIFVFLSIVSLGFSQLPTASNLTDDKGKRQGDWVIYYDADWEEIEDATNAEFYRKISYENDKPIGLVTDFFSNGIKQWEGELALDRPDVAHGVSRYFYDNGNLETSGKCLENERIGEWKNFTYLGKASHTAKYFDGVEQGVQLKIDSAFSLLENGMQNDLSNLIIEIVHELKKISNYNENNYVSHRLNEISYLYNSLGDYNNSLIINNEGLLICEKVYGKYHRDYAHFLNNIAYDYSHLGNYIKSFELNKICLKIRKKLYGVNHPRYVTTLSNLAFNYSEMGNIVKSLEFNKKCLSIREKLYGKDHQSYALSLNNIAGGYTALGYYNEALELYEKCLVIYEKIFGIKHSRYGTVLNNIAVIYSDLGMYSKSIEISKLSLEISSNIYGDNHPQYANDLANLAIVYHKIGNYSKSLEINELCLTIIEKYFDKFHPDYSRILNNLGANYASMNNYTKSLELCQEALKIREIVYGKEHLNYITSLGNLAQYYSELGNYTKSLELNKEALMKIENNYGKSHPDYANTLNNIAGVYGYLGDFEKSLLIYRKCLEFKKNIYGKNHEKYSLTLNNYAWKEINIKNYNSADTLFSQSYEIDQNLFFSNHKGFSETEKELYIKDLKWDLLNLSSYAVFRKEKKTDLIATISSAILNLKGALLNSNQQIKDEVFNSKDTSLINLYENWKLGKLQLGKYYETTLQELEKNGVDLKAEEEHVNALEQELSRKSLSFAESQKRYTWEDLKSKLKPNEAYLDLIRIDYYDFENDRSTDTVYYAALIIDENTKDYPELVVLEKGTQLEQSGFKYYSSYSSGRNKQRIDEYSYQNYWSAIAEKLKGKKRIYVSSDGVYNKINLNVLYNTETGKYLGEEVDIRLVTSGRDLFKTYPKSNEELTAVLVGSPKYDLMEEQVQDDDLLVSRDLQQNWIDSLSRGWSVSSLPGTAIEVSNISNLMSKNNWEVTTYTEEEALEGKVKSVSSPTVLHIATHGYFFEDVEKEKESPTRMMGIDSKKATQNPLLRSGLLFAGAKNTLNGNSPESGDNGLLTSYEASYMDLRGTELVVLSACNTARGEIKNGEGVYGLQRAIQQSGAENIIMSMWKVDDKVTQEFMTNFYDLWLSGKTKRDAFNQTQMIIKEKYKYPYYWGAFVMIGK